MRRTLTLVARALALATRIAISAVVLLLGLELGEGAAALLGARPWQADLARPPLRVGAPARPPRPPTLDPGLIACGEPLLTAASDRHATTICRRPVPVPQRVAELTAALRHGGWRVDTLQAPSGNVMISATGGSDAIDLFLEAAADGSATREVVHRRMPPRPAGTANPDTARK